MALNGSFARRLLAWYDREKRDLPWRGQTDPYRIWVSEAMLQQTVVATVIPYYNRFLERFPTVAALAAAPEADVMHAWAGLGYYSRARSLKRAAEAIVTEHGGSMPDQEHVLRTLPGVGPYTAAAVAAIAFGRHAFALDGNAARVMARVVAHEGLLEEPATKRALHACGLERVPRARAGDFAQAVMELGARVCVPRAPACAACPVAALCRAHLEGRVAELPRRRARRVKRPVQLVCVAVVSAGRVLLERRPSRGLLGGTWCLPSAELAAGKSVEETARAVVGAAGYGGGGPLRVLRGSVRHVFTHLDVQATVVEAHRPHEHPQPGACAGTGDGRIWLEPNRPPAVALASFTRKLLVHIGDADARAPDAAV